MVCPHCKKTIKGHANGTKDFRELSPEQMKAAIARATRSLNEMRNIYKGEDKGVNIPAEDVDDPFAL